MNEELTVHPRDEAEDLLPRIARRCLAEEAVESVIFGNRTDQALATRRLPGCEPRWRAVSIPGPICSPRNSNRLMRFVNHARRHVVAGNAILLPLARAHLTRADLRTLSRHMCGLPPAPRCLIAWRALSPGRRDAVPKPAFMPKIAFVAGCCCRFLRPGAAGTTQGCTAPPPPPPTAAPSLKPAFLLSPSRYISR